MFRINSLHPPAAAGAGLPSTIEEAVEATDTAGLPSTIEEATFEEVMESLVMEHADQLGHTDQLHHQLEHVHQAGKIKWLIRLWMRNQLQTKLLSD